MLFSKLVLICTVFGAASSLSVGPVQLPENRRYIDYQKGPSSTNSMLECVVHLDNAEELFRVSWMARNAHNEEGTFVWHPATGAEATGLLEGKVNLERADHNLELNKLDYNLSANYSCSATLSDGNTGSAAEWEAYVIDTTSSLTKSNTHGNTNTCEFVSSFWAYAVYPEPMFRAGMYSKQLNGYYNEVPQYALTRIENPNGTVAYSYKNYTLKIDEDTPDDSEFRTYIAVTKTGGFPIVLYSDSVDNYLWKEQGCHALRLDEYQTAEYNNSAVTCRQERKLPVQANVTCKEGYHADGNLKWAVVVCHKSADDHYEWLLQNGSKPHRKDLQCVTDGESSENGDGASGVSTSVGLVAITLLLQRLLHE